MPSTPLQLATGTAPKPPRELRRGIRFKGDRSKQLDAISGSPDAMVAADHPVRTIIQYVERLDLTALRAKLKPLGRTPMDPKFKLQLWLYASTIGLHAASAVARALQTDAALRLAAGGHSVSQSVLKDFRASNGPFLMELQGQLLAIAVAERVVSPQEVAVDSMRLEADASTASMRTKTRSTKRVEQLAKVDVAALTSEEKAEHDAKVAKHLTALARFEQEGRTSHSTTTPEAAFMKFPSGASLPGHRITAAVSGVTERFVLFAFVDSSPTDYGKLESAVLGARDALVKAGVPVIQGGPPMRVTADAGYMSEADLSFVVRERERGRIDTILPAAAERESKGLFVRDDFWFDDDDVICPAGKVMSGPSKSADGRLTWTGRGCEGCPLRAQCTAGKRRTLSITPATDELRAKVKARIEEPGGKEQYGHRIATVEPVFSYLEDVMKFTRASSRRTATVHAEVYMKLLAYNIMRLAAAAKRAEAERAAARPAAGGAAAEGTAAESRAPLRAVVVVLGNAPLGYVICDVWVPLGDPSSANA